MHTRVLCALKRFCWHPQTTTDAVRAAACRLGAAATGPAHRRRTRPTARTAARTSTRRRPAWAAEEEEEAAAAAEAATAAATRLIPVRTTGTAAIPFTTGHRCPTPRQQRRPFNWPTWTRPRPPRTRRSSTPRPVSTMQYVIYNPPPLTQANKAAYACRCDVDTSVSLIATRGWTRRWYFSTRTHGYFVVFNSIDWVCRQFPNVNYVSTNEVF